MLLLVLLFFFLLYILGRSLYLTWPQQIPNVGTTQQPILEIADVLDREDAATDLVVLDVGPVNEDDGGDWHDVHDGIAEAKVDIADVAAVLSVVAVGPRLVVLEWEVEVVQEIKYESRHAAEHEQRILQNNLQINTMHTLFLISLGKSNKSLNLNKLTIPKVYTKIATPASTIVIIVLCYLSCVVQVFGMFADVRAHDHPNIEA